MLGSVGLFVAAGMLQVAAEPASIRINLVAEVPVTCSTGAVLNAQATPSGLRAALAGSCNAEHVVRVTLVDGGEVRAAQLNAQTGTREADSFRFQRSAYFSPVSLLEVEFADTAPEPAAGASRILVEISPL